MTVQAFTERQQQKPARACGRWCRRWPASRRWRVAAAAVAAVTQPSRLPTSRRPTRATRRWLASGTRPCYQRSARTSRGRPSMRATCFTCRQRCTTRGHCIRTPRRRISRTRTLNGYSCAMTGFSKDGDRHVAREAAISYAAYRLIRHRFATSPGATDMLATTDALMNTLGYDASVTSTDLATGGAAAVGNRIAECYIAYGLQDGANEANGYAQPALPAGQSADRAAQARQPVDRRPRSLATDRAGSIRRPGRERHQFAAAGPEPRVGRGRAVCPERRRPHDVLPGRVRLQRVPRSRVRRRRSTAAMRTSTSGRLRSWLSGPATSTRATA